MQKLCREFKNVPGNAPQVSCSTSTALNRVQRLSVQSIVLMHNIPDVDQQSGKTGQNLRVFVLNMRNKPLMPVTPCVARHLLKQGRAKVVRRFPFTIRLNYATGETRQKITLGIDPGYSKVGFSAVTEKKELISGELDLDNRMTIRLSDKAMYRKIKRDRLWYRKSRFLNRISSKKQGWLPPSIKRRYQTHLILVEKLKHILPITKIIIEIANFDIQKIENPKIQGKEYQQGTMYEYRNRIAYLLAREKGRCQFCNKKYEKGNGWRLHHIWGKQKDRSQDWALLHESCHLKLHKEKKEKVLQKKKSKSYKASTFMSIIKNRFQKDLNCQLVYGYETFVKRNELGLAKTHDTDAFVISGGTNQQRTMPFQIIQTHRNNRKLQINRKGYKPSIRKKRYSIQPYDLFWVNDIRYVSKGIFDYGRYILYGNIKKKEYFNTKKIEKVFNFGSFMWQFIPS